MNAKQVKLLRRGARQLVTAGQLEAETHYIVGQDKNTGGFQLVLSAGCLRGFVQRAKRRGL